MKLGIFLIPYLKKQAAAEPSAVAQPVFYELAYEEQRLLQAITAAGHEAILACPLVALPEFAPREAWAQVHAWIPRVQTLRDTALHLHHLETLERAGQKLLNPSAGILLAKNKVETWKKARENGLSMPRTLQLQTFKDTAQLSEKLGPYPLILKDPFGTYGTGVMIVESQRSALSLLERLLKPWGDWDSILAQEFIAEAEGSDRRLFVLNGRVLAAIKRTAQKGEFRANAHRGAKTEPYEPTEAEIHLAVAATAALGLNYAGVDLIPSNRGPLLLEVNANPGFEALEKTTGLPIAELLVESLQCYRQES